MSPHEFATLYQLHRDGPLTPSEVVAGWPWSGLGNFHWQNGLAKLRELEGRGFVARDPWRLTEAGRKLVEA